MIVIFLSNFEKKKNIKIDKKGALLSHLAFPILIYGVHVGSDKGWTNPLALSLLTLGFIMLLIFIYVEAKTENPLLEVKVFKVSEFRKGIILMWLNDGSTSSSKLHWDDSWWTII
jgi:hypothetical protein